MPHQTARNLLLHNIIDPDNEKIRTILKSTKSNALLTECLQEIREREEDLEQHSSQSRKSDKIRRAFEDKKHPEKTEKPSEEPNLKHNRKENVRVPRYIGSEIQGNKKGLICAWVRLVNHKKHFTE